MPHVKPRRRFGDETPRGGAGRLGPARRRDRGAAWTASSGICRSCPRRDATVEAVRASDDDGLHVLRHSTAHVMAQAVCDLYPGAKYAIGPAIEDGFYYDFELPKPLVVRRPARDRGADARAGRGRRQPFVREEVSRADALERFADQPYKVEIIEGSGRRGRTRWAAATPSRSTATASGSTSASGRTCPPPGGWARSSLTNVAGAYWRGDEQRPMLTRIYGTAWATAGGPGCLPDAAGGGRAARSPQARSAARPVLLAGRARAGTVDLASARRDLPQAARGLRPRPPPGARIRPGRDAAHRAVGALGDLRPPGEVRRQHVSAHADGRPATTT